MGKGNNDSLFCASLSQFTVQQRQATYSFHTAGSIIGHRKFVQSLMFRYFTDSTLGMGTVSGNEYSLEKGERELVKFPSEHVHVLR